MPGFLSPGRGLPLLLIPEYSGTNKEQRIPDRSKTAHRKPPVKCFLTLHNDQGINPRRYNNVRQGYTERLNWIELMLWFSFFSFWIGFCWYFFFPLSFVLFCCNLIININVVLGFIFLFCVSIVDFQFVIIMGFCYSSLHVN